MSACSEPRGNVLPVLTPQEIQAALGKLPDIDHHGEIVEYVGDGELRMRLPFRREYMGRDV